MTQQEEGSHTLGTPARPCLKKALSEPRTLGKAISLKKALSDPRTLKEQVSSQAELGGSREGWSALGARDGSTLGSCEGPVLGCERPALGPARDGSALGTREGSALGFHASSSRKVGARVPTVTQQEEGSALGLHASSSRTLEAASSWETASSVNPYSSSAALVPNLQPLPQTFHPNPSL